MQHFKTYHSPMYRGFKAIESADYREVVRYFEKHEKSIVQLEFDEYFEMLVSYTHSLFEIGSYSRHVLMSDVVIEASIEQNVQYFHGEDVFYNMLFRKAASFYNLYEHDKAEHILKELIKIDPFNNESIAFLKKCLHDRKSSLIKNMRAAAMVLFLVTPMIIAAEVLFISHFYPQFEPFVRTVWMVTFLAGWVCYLSGDLLHRFKETKKVERYVSDAKAQKDKNEKLFLHS